MPKKVIPGEIWLASLELQEFGEQGSIRPIIIISQHTQTELVVAIPLTGNLEARRFPFTLELKKTQENGLSTDSIVLIFQIKSIAPTRMMKRMGKITPFQLTSIKVLLKDFLKL